jgi:hypothetical protein
MFLMYIYIYIYIYIEREGWRERDCLVVALCFKPEGHGFET